MIKLTARFVTATDEVWRLQSGNTPDCRFFQAMADKGHYSAKGGTRQGIYVCAPSGTLLASINSHDPEAVSTMLEKGLAAWAKQPQAERRLHADFKSLTVPRWEESLPEGGLILISVKRDLADAALPKLEDRSDRWNRDFVWFSRGEARSLLPADPQIGARHAVPELLVKRLAQFHLVDNVRGQTIPFAADDVAGSKLMVEITARNGQLVELSLMGESRAASSDAWGMSTRVWKPEPAHRRGLTTRLHGRATYDLTKEAFTRFDLLAFGRRWGFSENNARGRESEPGSIGIVFTLSPQETRRIPPAFIDVYEADWLVRPQAARD